MVCFDASGWLLNLTGETVIRRGFGVT